MRRLKRIGIGIVLGCGLLMLVCTMLCFGAVWTAEDPRDRVRYGPGEGSTQVTPPYTPRGTRAPNPNVTPEAEEATVHEQALASLADAYEQGWIRCALPADRPSLAADIWNGPSRIDNDVLTLMVSTPEGSLGLLPWPEAPFTSLHEGIEQLKNVVRSIVSDDPIDDFTRQYMEDASELNQLNHEPVFIVSWTGAEPGVQGSCTVTNEVYAVDVPVVVTYKDGTPASYIDVKGSDSQSGRVRTDVHGRAQLPTFLGTTLKVTATSRLYKRYVYEYFTETTERVEQDTVFRLVLDARPPEQWAREEALVRYEEAVNEGQLEDRPNKLEYHINVFMSDIAREVSERNRAIEWCTHLQRLQRGAESRDSSREAFATALEDDALSEAARARLEEWQTRMEDVHRFLPKRNEFLLDVVSSTAEAASGKDFDMPDCDEVLAE